MSKMIKHRERVYEAFGLNGFGIQDALACGNTTRATAYMRFLKMVWTPEQPAHVADCAGMQQVGFDYVKKLTWVPFMKTGVPDTHGAIDAAITAANQRLWFRAALLLRGYQTMLIAAPKSLDELEAGRREVMLKELELIEGHFLQTAHVAKMVDEQMTAQNEATGLFEVVVHMPQTPAVVAAGF